MNKIKRANELIVVGYSPFEAAEMLDMDVCNVYSELSQEATEALLNRPGTFKLTQTEFEKAVGIGKALYLVDFHSQAVAAKMVGLSLKNFKNSFPAHMLRPAVRMNPDIKGKIIELFATTEHNVLQIAKQTGFDVERINNAVNSNAAVKAARRQRSPFSKKVEYAFDLFFSTDQSISSICETAGITKATFFKCALLKNIKLERNNLGVMPLD